MQDECPGMTLNSSQTLLLYIIDWNVVWFLGDSMLSHLVNIITSNALYTGCIDIIENWITKFGLFVRYIESSCVYQAAWIFNCNGCIKNRLPHENKTFYDIFFDGCSL